ncbi:MAG: MurR/RpiR family transcriptional regulator [Candidatus Faecalibacterium intestinavium]|uniref:MurR/RpiR family transcriptional regulator n=1 Tax=Candidatus Faecalibacterium intestinavium TaxID=2838580 RepID=A0A9E2KJH1_9FIRM|nr:MurR/RpiR family transcriptional regulator [Candidatus Faecalibacterium intestinavium]
MPTNLRTVMERISAEYYHLTAAERKVADYVTDHQQDTQVMSISDLAEASGVAEATVTRFCRKLDYKGYNAFKLALAKNVASRRGIPFLSGEITPEDDIQEMCHKLYGAEVDAISQTLTLVRPENVARAADILTQADKVLCMGQGGSMIMAEEAAHIFSTGGMSFFALSDSHTQIIYTTTLTERDAIFFFSYSGATREAVELLELAHKRGVKIVLVTHFPKSPACTYANVVLQCGANEGPLQLGSVPARMAQLFLIDTLFAEVCRRKEGAVEQVRQDVADALAAKHF